jgi:hypothetical protein
MLWGQGPHLTWLVMIMFSNLLRIFVGVKGGRLALKADNLTENYEPVVWTMWEP